MKTYDSDNYLARKHFYCILLVLFLLIATARGDINELVAQIDIGNADREDVLRVFGEPQAYILESQVFDPNNLPLYYFMEYYDNDFSVLMIEDRVCELRIGSGELGFTWEGGLQIGSPLEDVLAILGEPRETRVGQSVTWEPDILYKDIEGQSGRCYFHCSDPNARIFFLEYKICALYIIDNFPRTNDSSDPNQPILFPKIDRRPAVCRFDRGLLQSLPSYDPNDDSAFQVDLRSYDLSALDLTSSLYDLLHSIFNTRTIWPSADQMPIAFDWQQMTELGKNPGLGVRDLHDCNITGAGVGIAIVDQPLLTDHQEYAQQLRLYEEINIGSYVEAQMHGSAVCSIAVGLTCGVAPDADLYYIGAWTGDWGDDGLTYNFTYYAQGVRRILEINEQLSKDRKIRVIAMQVGWNASQAGYDDIMAACAEAKAAGMLIVSSCIDDIHEGFNFHGLGRHPLSDPDLFESYEPGSWWAQDFYNGWRFTNRLLVPMDCRTTASPCGTDEYVFYASGGWSWSIPYIAGVYALAVQVDPTITPDQFWSLAMSTGRTIELTYNNETIDFGPIVDPCALIDAL